MQKTFDEVVIFARTGLNPRQNFKLGQGNNAYITIKNIKNNKLVIDDNTDVVDDDAIRLIHRRSQIKKGDILFASIGRMGDMFIIEDEPDGWDINESVFAFTLDTNIIRQKYFYYIFKVKSTLDYLSSNSSGSTFKSIKMNQLKKMVFDIPSLEVQDQIIRGLDKVSNIIELRKMELQNLDNLIKARFVELFGSMESKIPISEMCNVTGGYSFKSGDISDDGAIKILQIGNVYLDNVSWETTNYLPEGFDEKYSKFMLDEGDIVVALTRPIIQSLGNVKACIVKSSDLPCLLNQRVGRIVAKKEKSVFLEFIYGCLMTDDFTRYVESCSIGCSQPNISTKDIENYLIPNATYEEQKAYVEFKKQTDKSKFAVQKSLEEAQLLFNSLMQKYFG